MATNSNRAVGYTCPSIDAAISLLEDLRSDNAGLRAWGEEERLRANRLQEEVDALRLKVQALTAELNEVKEHRFA